MKTEFIYRKLLVPSRMEQNLGKNYILIKNTIIYLKKNLEITQVKHYSSINNIMQLNGRP